MTEGRVRFALVRLSGGRCRIVPGSLVLLNPEHEGARAHIWGVWAHAADEACDLTDAAAGRCEGPLMGYFSDRDDLWKFGQHGTVTFRDRDDSADCKEQALILQLSALGCLTRAGMEAEGPLVLAWALLDTAGPDLTTPMGTSFAFEGARSWT